MPEATRVLLVDDHAIFRDCLSHVLSLQAGIRIVGAVGTVGDALEVLNYVTADVVLLDYDLGYQNGSEAMAILTRRGFRGRIAILTAWVERNDIASLLAHGVTAIVLKDRPLEFVVQLVRNLTDPGFSWIDDRCHELLFAGHEAPLHPTEHGFSAREREVLQLIVAGLSNKEIAAHQALSETSVKATIQRLFGKVGVRSRGQLIRLALERHRAELQSESGLDGSLATL
jgi:two-component system, NarL family, nitrate/nitrite response regulator NarL